MPLLTPTLEFTAQHIQSVDDLDFDNLHVLPRLKGLDVGSMSVLNLGAGTGEGFIAGHIRDLPVAHIENVELHDEALWELSHKPHAAGSKRFVHENMLDYARMAPSKSFDVCLVVDAIEHLTREQGMELLQHLSRIVRYRTLLWVPFGDTPQDEYGGNPWQQHNSTWHMIDFLTLPVGDVEVDVCWKHLHIQGHPLAGWVTINYP